MDPLSVIAGVVGISDSISKLCGAIVQFKEDYRLADDDLDAARDHAILLREEIRGLDLKMQLSRPPDDEKHHGEPIPHHSAVENPAFAKAMSVARDVLTGLEKSFSLRASAHTWRSKIRWALKDKQALAQLKGQLQSAESTLQGLVAMEQL